MTAVASPPHGPHPHLGVTSLITLLHEPKPAAMLVLSVILVALCCLVLVHRVVLTVSTYWSGIIRTLLLLTFTYVAHMCDDSIMR